MTLFAPTTAAGALYFIFKEISKNLSLAGRFNSYRRSVQKERIEILKNVAKDIDWNDKKSHPFIEESFSTIHSGRLCMEEINHIIKEKWSPKMIKCYIKYRTPLNFKIRNNKVVSTSNKPTIIKALNLPKIAATNLCIYLTTGTLIIIGKEKVLSIFKIDLINDPYQQIITIGHGIGLTLILLMPIFLASLIQLIKITPSKSDVNNILGIDWNGNTIYKIKK